MYEKDNYERSCTVERKYFSAFVLFSKKMVSILEWKSHMHPHLSVSSSWEKTTGDHRQTILLHVKISEYRASNIMSLHSMCALMVFKRFVEKISNNQSLACFSIKFLTYFVNIFIDPHFICKSFHWTSFHTQTKKCQFKYHNNKVVKIRIKIIPVHIQRVRLWI